MSPCQVGGSGAATFRKDTWRATVSGIMTGQELRNAILARGISHNQFLDGIADEVAANEKQREYVKRNAKRWLSEEKRNYHLRFNDRNRQAVATVVGLDAASLMPPEPNPVEIRLESLAVDLAKSARKQATMAKELRQLRVRVQRLEARPWPAEDQPTGQAETPG